MILNKKLFKKKFYSSTKLYSYTNTIYESSVEQKIVNTDDFTVASKPTILEKSRNMNSTFFLNPQLDTINDLTLTETGSSFPFLIFAASVVVQVLLNVNQRLISNNNISNKNPTNNVPSNITFTYGDGNTSGDYNRSRSDNAGNALNNTNNAGGSNLNPMEGAGSALPINNENSGEGSPGDGDENLPSSNAPSLFLTNSIVLLNICLVRGNESILFQVRLYNNEEYLYLAHGYSQLKEIPPSWEKALEICIGDDNAETQKNIVSEICRLKKDEGFTTHISVPTDDTLVREFLTKNPLVNKRMLPIEVIAPYMYLRIEAAAKLLNICPTVLKSICRRHGIVRWKYRFVKSLIDAINLAVQPTCKIPIKNFHQKDGNDRNDGPGFADSLGLVS